MIFSFLPRSYSVNTLSFLIEIIGYKPSPFANLGPNGYAIPEEDILSFERAAFGKDPDFVTFYKRAYARFKHLSVLQLALLSNDLEMVSLLLRETNLPLRERGETRSGGSETILLFACKEGVESEIIEMLLSQLRTELSPQELEEFLAERDEQGFTAVDYAKSTKRPDLLHAVEDFSEKGKSYLTLQWETLTMRK